MPKYTSYPGDFGHVDTTQRARVVSLFYLFIYLKRATLPFNVLIIFESKLKNISPFRGQCEGDRGSSETDSQISDRTEQTECLFVIPRKARSIFLNCKWG